MRFANMRSCWGGIFVLTLGAFVAGLPKNLFHKAVCSNQAFRLNCNLKSIIVIHKAYFTTNSSQENITCDRLNSINTSIVPCREDIRRSLNNRCSGMGHCHYNLTEDHPSRICTNLGVVMIDYACIPESSTNKYCNANIQQQPYGYVISPGYPRFYPALNNCTWTFEAGESQKVAITILDLAMKFPYKYKKVNVCDDSITIFDGTKKLLQTCGVSADNLKTVVSMGNKVSIRMFTKNFKPSRGFLIYYKFQGCPTLPPPKLGYMVYRNESSALYMCCKDHLFNDTIENSRLLHCVDNLHWNGSVVPCMTFDEIKGNKNTTHLQPELEDDGDDDGSVIEAIMPKQKFIEDILIPSALIVGLVLGNVAIVLVILRMRKKQKGIKEEETPYSAPPTIAPRVSLSDI